MTRNQRYYARNKERLRSEAIEFQFKVFEERIPWWDAADYTAYFEEKGKRFGLLREFRENDII